MNTASDVTLRYVYSLYGELSKSDNDIVSYYRSGESTTITSSGSRTSLSSGSTSYSINTARYNPVIDLKDATLLSSYESYSSSYKNKYSSCDSSKLGSYDCPYLLKFTNGYYSDGTNS